MGRGSSKAGGGSGVNGAGGAGGNIAEKTEGVVAVSEAEKEFYDLPKNVTQKQIKEMLSKAPVGTKIAYGYENGYRTTIYEKQGNSLLSDEGRWTEVQIDRDGGVAARWAQGSIVSKVQDMAKSKYIVKGLNAEQQRIYDTSGQNLLRAVKAR